MAARIEDDSIKQREGRALFETENGTVRGYVSLYNGSRKNTLAFWRMIGGRRFPEMIPSGGYLHLIRQTKILKNVFGNKLESGYC